MTLITFKAKPNSLQLGYVVFYVLQQWHFHLRLVISFLMSILCWGECGSVWVWDCSPSLLSTQPGTVISRGRCKQNSIFLQTCPPYLGVQPLNRKGWRQRKVFSLKLSTNHGLRRCQEKISFLCFPQNFLHSAYFNFFYIRKKKDCCV